jgi:hypothetical protein
MKLRMAPCVAGQFYMQTDEQAEVYTWADVVRDGVIASDSVVCVKTRSAREARDLAGSHESGSFAWGRFYFRGDVDTLAEIRHAVTRREPVNDSFPDWTFDQLANHLQARGLQVRVRPFEGEMVDMPRYAPIPGMEADPSKVHPFAPRVVVLTDSDKKAGSVAFLFALTKFGRRGAVLGAPPAETLPRYAEAVICRRNTSAVRANGACVADTDPGSRCFAWRRFAFLVPRAGPDSGPRADALRDRLKAALGPP